MNTAEEDKYRGLHEDYTYSKYRPPRRREGIPSFGVHDEASEEPVRYRRRSSEESLDGDRRTERERATPSPFAASTESPDAAESKKAGPAAAKAKGWGSGETSKRRKSSTTGLLDDEDEVLAYEREGGAGKRRSLSCKLMFVSAAFCLWAMWVLGVRWLVGVLTGDAEATATAPIQTQEADPMQRARGGNAEPGQ